MIFDMACLWSKIFEFKIIVYILSYAAPYVFKTWEKKYDIIEDIIIYHYSLYSIPNYLEQFSILGLTVCEKCVQKSSFAKVYKEAWSKQFFLQTIEVQNNFLMYQLYQHFLSKKIENGRSVYYYHTAYSLHCSYLYSKQLYVQKSADVCIKKVISVLWSQVLKLKIERTWGVWRLYKYYLKGFFKINSFWHFSSFCWNCILLSRVTLTLFSLKDLV